MAPPSRSLKHPIVDALGTNRVVLLPGAAPIKVAGAGHAGDCRGGSRRPDARADGDSADGQLVVGRKRAAQGAADLGPQHRRRARPAGRRHCSRRARRSEQPGGARQGKPRLVLFSCPAMAENIFQDLERTNLDMLMIAAGWLRGREDTMGIRTQPACRADDFPSIRSFGTGLILVPSVVAVLSIIAMGVIVFTARRE